MINIIKFFIDMIQMLSFIGLIILVLIGGLYEIVGPVIIEKIMSSIGISFSLRGYNISMGIIILLQIIIWLIKDKL